MKKVSLLIAMIAFVCGNAFAQFSYDFTDCPAGAKIASTLGMPWSTWSEDPGSSEDGVFAEVDGNMAAYFTYGVDQILAFGDKTTGVYNIEFDVYIEEGKIGYFNLCHHFPNPANSQAVQVYLQCTNDGTTSSNTISDGHGTVHAGSNGSVDLPCRWNDWMHFKIHVDLDQDQAELWFDGELKHTWQWSLNSFGEEGYSDRTLGGVDFFPPVNASNSKFYVDNVVFTVEGGEEELIGDSFEEYPVGGKIAASAIAAGHDWWTTWNNTSGGSNDGTVSDAYASEGSNSGYFTSSSDQVLLMGNVETGAYDFSFDIYTAAGKDGYFNLLHTFPASGNGDWAMQAYFNAESDETNSNSWHSTGHGTVHAAGAKVADLACVEDEWMHVLVHIDCDNDQATLYFNEEEIYTWQWSLGSFGDPGTRVIAGANFFGPMASSQFYVDNIRFVKIGGESAPDIDITPASVSETLEPNDMVISEVVIANNGNSIGDWRGWLDFGEGGEGSQTAEVYLHNNSYGDGIGYSEAYTREMAMRLTPSSYAGSAMGMKLVSAKYYVNNSYASADNNYIFRVYSNGTTNQPEELLAEKTVNSSVLDTWITATFDETIYLTGKTYWITVQVEQAANEFPCSMDSGNYGEESDGNWISNNGSQFYHVYNGDSGITGNWMISANCQGQLVPGTWASIDKEHGSIFGGQSESITLTINSINMPVGSYNATLRISTNDADAAQVEIPVSLYVSPTSVDEASNGKVAVYPNPASSSITVKGEDLSYAAIYNVTGQLVNVVKLNNGENTVDLTMGAGVYFFSIYDHQGNSTVQRVVVTE